MTVRIGINGLGRIGRCVMRALIQENANDITLVAANGPADTAQHVHLLKYDSVHGRFPGDIVRDEVNDRIDMGRGWIQMLHTRDPGAIDWGALGVDVVLECTGKFTSRAECETHVRGGAKKVLISAPAKDDCPTFVYGVNDGALSAEMDIISIGSCTTNALAPVAKVLHERFEILQGYMTTVHAYTGDQNLVDGSHADLRRARAAGLSMVPAKTGAAKAIGLVLPELEGRLQGAAIRVPTANVSLVDLTVMLAKNTDADAINAAMCEAAKGAMQGVLAVNDEPLVSVDFYGRTESSIYDAMQCRVSGSLAHVAAWYDNEWGFSCRMLDMARRVSGQQ